jgi:hypothetical protein
LQRGVVSGGFSRKIPTVGKHKLVLSLRIAPGAFTRKLVGKLQQNRLQPRCSSPT